MQEVIREYLGMAKVGRKQAYKNMAVYPLLSDYSLGLEYILLDEALGSGVIEVTEVNEPRSTISRLASRRSTWN